MEEIVKVLLQEGIDEETIHEVLDVIAENYEIVDETVTVGDAAKAAKKVKDSRLDAITNIFKKVEGSKFGTAIDTIRSEYPRAYNRAAFAHALSEYPENSKVPLKTLLQAAKGSREQRDKEAEGLRPTAHFKKSKSGCDKRYSKQNKPYQKAANRAVKAANLTKNALDES